MRCPPPPDQLAVTWLVSDDVWQLADQPSFTVTVRMQPDTSVGNVDRIRGPCLNVDKAQRRQDPQTGPAGLVWTETKLADNPDRTRGPCLNGDTRPAQTTSPRGTGDFTSPRVS